MTKLTGRQVAEAGLEGWAYLARGLQTRIRTPDFATGLSIVNAIGVAAEQMDHHPDVDLRYDHVDVLLTSHDEMGVTGRDVRLARRICSLAAEAGLRTECASVSRLELGLDSPEFQVVLPFWGAVLSMEDLAARGCPDELDDPFGDLPAIWFQRSGREEPRQRWHPDVWVDPGQVQSRIDAATAAGGTLVDNTHAPSFWVLADPEGNRVCLCTWQERD